MNTGEIIKYFRLARNMTQEQLAQDAEISFSTLRKYEANERNPKYEQLSKIADALGISVNLFMDFEIQSVSDLFSILFQMEGQADLEIATSKDLADLSEDTLFLHFKNGYINHILSNYHASVESIRTWMFNIVKKLYQKSRTDYWMTIAVSILTVLLYLQIPINLHFLFLLLIRLGLNYPLTVLMKKKNK